MRFRAMGCRLMVGRLTLNQVVGVRIPAAQPIARSWINQERVSCFGFHLPDGDPSSSPRAADPRIATSASSFANPVSSPPSPGSTSPRSPRLAQVNPIAAFVGPPLTGMRTFRKASPPDEATWPRVVNAYGAKTRAWGQRSPLTCPRPIN